MGLSHLDLSPVGWQGMTDSWWDKAVAGFLLGSFILGLLYSCYHAARYTLKKLKHRQKNAISPPVARYLRNMRRKIKHNPPAALAEEPVGERTKTFGVFLGSFSDPPTQAQLDLLSRWQVFAVDPFQPGVLNVLQTNRASSQEILARLDVCKFISSNSIVSHDDVVQSLENLTQTFETLLGNAQGGATPFTGILLTNFRSYYQPAIINELAKYVRYLGRELWLELSYPNYLTKAEAQEINMSFVRGLVYRNGTIRPDGDRQNYFQMEPMRAVMRAVAAQCASHGPKLVMWESVDDSDQLQYSVVTRTYNWCTFNSALCWIGHNDALYDADIANIRTLTAKPLGALMWLKDEDNMRAHDAWRENDHIATTSQGHEEIYEHLAPFISDLPARLQLSTISIPRPVRLDNIFARRRPRASDLYNIGKGLRVAISEDEEVTGLGCFQLGHVATFSEFHELAQNQSRLKDLDLLAEIDQDDLSLARQRIQALQGVEDLSLVASQAVDKLVDLLSTPTDENGNHRIQIYSGLRSGFQTETNTQYWGLYEIDPASDCITLYLSNYATDRASTILHTFLSSQQCSRLECFMAEQTMAELNGRLSPGWQLPERIVQDIQQLSPGELLQLHMRLQAAKERTDLFKSIFRCLEHQLMDETMLTQQRALNAVAYLGGDISVEELVTSRLTWLSNRGCQTPGLSEAIQLFEEVDQRVVSVLMNNDSHIYERLSSAMQTLMLADSIDAGADILALSVFCAFRKLAMDELYLEVMDRNPYPNHAADQAACFAENFSLGSRCDSFFDTTPRIVGKIISDRYRRYYMKHQPPRRDHISTELPTTYAAMQADCDPGDGSDKISFRYRVTFFSIFAVPALIDVMLLTTVGRGLYLTTFMTSEQKTMATVSLMLALLLSGAFGQWICSGGSYYFYANAFPAMNLFVLTRFTAGIAVSFLVAIIGFIAIIITRTATAALIFVFYFIMLSTYFLVLNALSIYQMPGSEFLSGRTTIITCIPILFISPIVSMITEKELSVYLPVLSAFLVVFLWKARNVVSRWSSWYLNIPSVTDSEIINWYRQSASDTGVQLNGIGDNKMMPIARAAFFDAVVREDSRWFFTKSTKDPLVRKMAKGFKSTLFLMRWYCRHKRSWMPLPYSTTWNLTLKAGMENMMNMQKGLKLHSAFLHWRSTGKDVWSGLLYFVVALLDKWAALLTGSSLVGLSVDAGDRFRLALGFGLCYYLFGAVSLDIISQPLWEAAHEAIDIPITSLDSLKQANAEDGLARRNLYWRSLCKLFFLHLWGASLFAALMWTFQSSQDNSVMFLAYVGAYSGLLWYQYNKIYCGPDGAKPLLAASIVGLPIGIALHICLPSWPYSGIVSLAVATWIACIYSMFLTNIGRPPFLIWKPEWRSVETEEQSPLAVTYSASTLHPHHDISQFTLGRMFESIRAVPPEDRYILDPSKHPGKRVLELLSLRRQLHYPPTLKEAFQSARGIVDLAAKSWIAGDLIVELSSSRSMPFGETKVQTISRKTRDRLHIIVILGPDSVHQEWVMNLERNWRIITEAIVQSFSEHQLGMSHEDATLAQLLVVDHFSHDDVSIPEGIKHRLETDPSGRVKFIQKSDDTLLRYVLLGIDCDREWEMLPESVQAFMLRRCSGSFDAPIVEVEEWICSRFGSQNSHDARTHIARCDLGASMIQGVLSYARSVETDGFYSTEETEYGGNSETNSLIPRPNTHQDPTFLSTLKRMVALSLRSIKLGIKFFILSFVADPEYQRELDFLVCQTNRYICWPFVLFLNTIWAYCKVLQTIIIPVVLFHGHEHVSRVEKLVRGTTTILEKDKIITEDFDGPSTWFWTTMSDGSLRVSQYNGRHNREPNDSAQLLCVNTYNDRLVLQRRRVYRNGKVTNIFHYDYDNRQTKMPLQRHCIRGELEGQIVKYDHRGYISSGSSIRGDSLVSWKYCYRRDAKHEDELLWAEYTFPDTTIKVLWSMPHQNPDKRLDEWVPFSVVTEATFIQGHNTFHASWDFEHKLHPEVSVTLNGNPVSAPPMISEDWFHVLKKPENCSFLNENPLLSFSSIKSSLVSRILGLNAKRYPISTAAARTQLWKAWKNGREIDAISAQWIDEALLRSDQVMRPYWRRRDFGLLGAAKRYIDTQADTVMARVDVDPQISSWVHIAFKLSDLSTFGRAGDARINTRHLSSQIMDNEHELHVLCMDTSTWPNDPGGVSACRRDMINDLNTIKWHVLAESANDYGVPRFQIERNVQSLTILPLWGLDFLNPVHGILESSLDTAVVQRSFDTCPADIMQNFIPILGSLVKCARTVKLTREHVEEATNALVHLNTYFETSRNWSDVWNHPIVKERWRELWLSEDIDDALNISEWWDFEMPTIKQLDEALNLWSRYLFIFSLPVPEHIPDVFQASHHFTGATYGIVCKKKRNISLHIWDHCISYREFTTFMSSAVSHDAPFVNSTLISLTHLSCVLLEHHADVVLPCCDYFNPGWEKELGTAEGAIEHRRSFARKIDPVINGICNMEKFEPTEVVRTNQPTVVMLSHVQYVKDIKNAIMAANLIVNEWGFKDYHLHIYGDQERAAVIATECQELIASKNLQNHVILKGLGAASVVLQDAWLFLNSSISEGLPLAMGEAALTGVPVVCTDVGASYCVVTDRATGDRFSEVVPPNDSESLARAQISILALLGPWSKHAEDSPGVEVPVLEYPVPSPESVRKISRRMYSKQEQRRSLGMLGRENVLKNFSSDRYLREHEQMLWIGKLRSPANRSRNNVSSTSELGRTSTWSREIKSPYSNWARPGSRLTPESWVSLTSEEYPRGGWLSASSSTLILKELFSKETYRKSNLSIVETQAPNS
ncbi:hypothetical protein JX266_010669 [Neoarthrinium moseri]|nr:hypothetical protein JX266_010669 [Neoarthrinium moseri]